MENLKNESSLNGMTSMYHSDEMWDTCEICSSRFDGLVCNKCSLVTTTKEELDYALDILAFRFGD